VAVGDVVEQEQSLITLESDKASMEIPSTAAGTVTEIKVSVGDQVSEGDLIVVLSAQADSAAPVAKEVKVESSSASNVTSPAKAAPVTSTASSPVTSKPMGHIHASPAVRKFARELGVDLSTVTKATGPKGRLLKRRYCPSC
jgi:Pyruvate/2-oxoglutarate dehydrogenase complex, dihydrolipoamide acyltransferase (E2) component, and related enzymes